MLGRIGFLGALLLATIAAPAQAAWLRATSRHFVIYSDIGADRLREQAVELERFDALLRFFHKTADADDATFNKVTIYVLPSVDAVRRLSGGTNIAGFYVPRASGSVAFTPRSAGSGGGANDLTPRIVLYHEYAHHFLLGNYAIAYPAWFSEGYAEFAATATKKDGFYWLGAAANHRAYGLLAGRMPARQLFDPPSRMNDLQRDQIYGRGWLLTHYVLFDEKRRAQMERFIAAFNRDVPVLEAAQQAFGDLATLDKELDRYLGRNRIPAIKLPAAELGDPKVEIAPLSAGEAAMIDFRVQSTRGVNGKTGPALYAKAALVAARYPADGVVQGWFAEMAIDAGQLDAAEKAADTAIAADATSSQALLYKARVRFARLLAAKSHDEKEWNAARQWIVRANRVQNNDAAALQLFYQSFLMQGAEPRASAKLGLYRAVELVPQDQGMRFMAARQQVLDGEVDDAKRSLRPLASDPHAGADNPAAKLLAALDAGKTGQAALDVIEKPETPPPPTTPAS